MSELIDPQEHQRAVEQARREGALAARRRSAHVMIAAFGTLAVLFFGTIAVGWTLVQRAQDAAPEVIEEIAKERREAVETRLLIRSQEAQTIAIDLFVFLQRVWQENEALHRVRSNMQNATTQLHLLTSEVNAAFDSPTRHMGTLLRNGPTRAHALLDYAVAVAGELQRLVPVVASALQNAKVAAIGDTETAALPAVLSSMDALLDPFIGSNGDLEAQWRRLQTDILSWVERVYSDLDFVREEMSGEQLSDEFMLRLRARVL